MCVLCVCVCACVCVYMCVFTNPSAQAGQLFRGLNPEVSFS